MRRGKKDITLSTFLIRNSLSQCLTSENIIWQKERN